MNRLSKLIDDIRSKLYYQHPVYIPGYEYSPWKKWVIISILALIVALIVANILNHRNTTTEQSVAATASTTPIQATRQQSGISQTLPQQNETQQTSNNLTLYPVTRVIDGDTIDVSVNGSTERIRLIGVNTPETVDPRKPVQCYGVEASNFVKSLLNGKKVGLESDSTQGDKDKYNRLLRFVFLSDGTNLDEKIIAEGYGHEYTYNKPYKYQTQFKQAEHLAQVNKLGLWSPNTCNGVTR